MEASSTSWERAFSLLDIDRNDHVTIDEFATGFRLASPPGGSSFFIPTWIIWALPLLAVACLCARYMAREAVRGKTYLQVGTNDEPSGKTLPLHRPSRSKDLAGAKVSTPRAEPPKGSYDWRAFRGCNGLGKIGLLECGWRKKNKDQASPGKPQCSKCGWSCRCPECGRDARVLPPVLAWRGPDESVEEDEIQALIRGMQADPTNTGLQESSCGRLEQLALGPTSKKKIVALGGIEVILETMRRQSFDARVQEHACGALGNLSLRSEETQQQIGRSKGVEAISKAMVEHPESTALQERACWATEQLAMIPQNRSEIVDSGGIDQVVRAMRAHPSSEAVQEHGCMALGNLAFDVDTRKRIAQGGGIDSIVQAMGAFPANGALQEDACFALHNMACSDEAMKPISEAGGIEAVLAAMREHPTVPGVQENAINALHNVNCGPLSYVHKVANENGIKLIMQAMDSHSVPSLQAKACHVLGQLGDRDDDVRKEIERAGGVNVIELAKSTFHSSKEVQQEAREALKILKDS